MFQLPERFRFNLSDAFARHAELLPHFFQRVIRIHADPEAHAEDSFFARCELGHHTDDCLPKRSHHGYILFSAEPPEQVVY